MVTWSECKKDFAGDGSLRDVYVLNGGLDAWDALLQIARVHGAHFSVHGKRAPLPPRALDVFDAYEPVAVNLSLSWRGIELVAHFFAEKDVELDFVPNGLTGQDRLDDLCSFLRELAIAANREVIVTPENCPQSPFLKATQSGTVRYLPSEDAA
jgi:hypothetical protein